MSIDKGLEAVYKYLEKFCVICRDFLAHRGQPCETCYIELGSG